MKHLADPYEQYLCGDVTTKVFEEEAETAKDLKELDCPDCILEVWKILEEALV